MTVSIIVAYDQNKLIGTVDNKLPWNIPEDLKLFKEKTKNHFVIMGKNTWLSLPKKPLPNRFNIVISTTLQDKYENMCVAKSLIEGVDIAKHHSLEEEIFIIGGKQVYQESLDKNLVDKICVSQIKGLYQGDVYFPDIHFGWGINKIKFYNDFIYYELYRNLDL